MAHFEAALQRIFVRAAVLCVPELVRHYGTAGDALEHFLVRYDATYLRLTPSDHPVLERLGLGMLAAA